MIDEEMIAKEGIRISQQNSRTKRIGLIGNLTIKEWLKIIDDHNGMCHYCKKKPFTELDHVIPIEYGGHTTKTNVVPACSTCNRNKKVMIDERKQKIHIHIQPSLLDGIPQYRETLDYRKLGGKNDEVQNNDLESGIIKPLGVGLKTGEREALKTIGNELGGISTNSLCRYAIRYFIIQYRLGNINLNEKIEVPPEPKKRLRMD